MALPGLPALPKSLSVLLNADQRARASFASPSSSSPSSSSASSPMDAPRTAAMTASLNSVSTNRTRDLIAHHHLLSQHQERSPRQVAQPQQPYGLQPARRSQQNLSTVGKRGPPPPAPPRPSKSLSSSGMKTANGPPSVPPPPPPKENQAVKKFDSQMAHLRREMDGLRQMDLSLLYQLWTLNDSIQEYKQVVEERAWDADGIYSDTMDEIYERGPPCGNGEGYRIHSPRGASRSGMYDAHYENTGGASSLDYGNYVNLN